MNVSNWLDRLYGDGPAGTDPSVREYDLGMQRRVARRPGVPAHSAQDPARFRDPEPADGFRDGGARRSRSMRRRVLAPVVVALVGLGAVAMGRSALDAVGPDGGSVLLTDPPPLTGPNGASGSVAASPGADDADEAGKDGTPTGSVSATTGASVSAEDESGTGSTPVTGNSGDSSASSSRASSSSGTKTRPTGKGDSDRENGTGQSSVRARRTDRDRGRQTEEPKAGRSGKCDANYAVTCVPVAVDVDCANSGGDGPAYLATPARVVGKDIYHLDSNGDGWAC